MQTLLLCCLVEIIYPFCYKNVILQKSDGITNHLTFSIDTPGSNKRQGRFVWQGEQKYYIGMPYEYNCKEPSYDGMWLQSVINRMVKLKKGGA